MSQSFEYCDERALAAEAAAAKSELGNVRERELRCARVWRDMADQALVNQVTRAADQERIKQRSEAGSPA
jgi:hypothetical protein